MNMNFCFDSVKEMEVFSFLWFMTHIITEMAGKDSQLTKDIPFHGMVLHSNVQHKRET
jgi:hypothetical protein